MNTDEVQQIGPQTIPPETSVAAATRMWKARIRLRRLIQEGRLSEALNYANRLIKEDPADRNAWYERAYAQFFLHDYAAAQESFDVVLQMNPNDQSALTGKGLCFCDTKEYESALEYFWRAVDLKPGDAIVWSQMGRAYAELHNHRAAVDAYSKAISIDTEFVEAWHYRAQSLRALGRDSEALYSFDVALYHDPEDADVWNDRGALFAAEFNRLDGRFGPAAYFRVLLLREVLRCWESAITLQSNHPDALANLEELEELPIDDYDQFRHVVPSVETALGLEQFEAFSRSVEDTGLVIKIEDGVAKVPTIHGVVTVKVGQGTIGAGDDPATATSP